MHHLNISSLLQQKELEKEEGKRFYISLLYFKKGINDLVTTTTTTQEEVEKFIYKSTTLPPPFEVLRPPYYVFVVELDFFLRAFSDDVKLGPDHIQGEICCCRRDK